MTTDTEVLAAGFVLPQGDDLLRNGDDAIRTNAKAAYTQAKAAHDAALAGRMYRGTLPACDLDALIAPADTGVWGLSGARAYGGHPWPGSSAMLTIENGGLGAATQTITLAGLTTTLTRTARNLTTDPPLWWDWTPVGTVGTHDIPAGTDLDTLRSTRDWTVVNTPTAQTLVGWPEGVPYGPAHLQVRAISTGVSFQQLHTYGPGGTVLSRQTASVGSVPFPWSSWRDLASAGTTSSSAGIARNRILQEDFYRRHPIRELTTGAVALRFDHGLASFDQLVRPLLDARNLPYSLVLNSSSWGLAENAGVTPEMVNSWVQAGRAEVWNHGQWHYDVPVAQLPAMIVDGLTQLRQQLPDASIDGFALAGVGGTGYQGLLPVTTAAKLADTTAGRLMLEHHAVVTGAIPDTAHRPLDGTIRQGMSHLTLDTTSLSAAISAVATAQQDRTGLQVMVHPSLVDQPGGITLVDLTAWLDHITTERDAGRLAILGPYDLMTARVI